MDNSTVIEKKIEERSVGILLGIGILLFPMIFSWVTLREGYTVVERGISFFWLMIIFVVLIIDDEPQAIQKAGVVSSEVSANVTTQSFDKRYKTNSTEYLLASIDSKRELATDSYLIHDYKRLLNTLSKRSGMSEKEIGDLIVYARNRIRSSNGKEYSVLEMLNAADTASQSGVLSLKEAVAFLIVSLSAQ